MNYFVRWFTELRHLQKCHEKSTDVSIHNFTTDSYM